jgi:tRNA(Met) cytidine acetyltransferase
MGFAEIYHQCQSIAKRAQHRQLLWLHGDANWCYAQLQNIAPLLLRTKSVGVFSKVLNTQLNLCQQQITNKECQRLLGQEVDTLVYDAFSGFNPDSLSQISGSLVAGGVFVLVTPAADQWSQWNDPELDKLWVQPFNIEDVQRNFLNWVLSSLQQDKHLIHYAQQQCSQVIKRKMRATPATFNIKAVSEQQVLVKESANNLLAKTDTSIVLTAPRGRGKSAALGLLINQIASKRKVFLTASDASAVQQVQKFANSDVHFYTVQQLLSADLRVSSQAVLIVDEAASISVDVLLGLSCKFSQCVYSSTTDGYEGTGQGFKLRFLKYLAQKGQHCRFFELTRPMRWAPNDPLENWLNQSMLLKISGQSPSCDQLENTYQIDKIEPQQLLDSPPLMEQLYTLLSQAHYRTTPSDLRIILDSPNMHLWITRLKHEIVAVCLLAEEGPMYSFGKDDQGLDGKALIAAIYRGLRRPRGNLIPQVLIAQEGEITAGSLRFARIVRIATADSQRRKSLASQLLDRLASWAQTNGVDYLGANFSIEQDLLDFWQHSGFSLVRFGHQQDKITASYNALVLRAVGTDDTLLKHLTRTFHYKLAYQQQRLSDLPVISSQIMAQHPKHCFEQHLLEHPEYLVWCKEQLHCFAHFYRPLESVGYIAELLLKTQRATVCLGLAERDRQLLDDYFIKHISIDTLCLEYSLNGYRSLVKTLRSAVKAWLNALDQKA